MTVKEDTDRRFEVIERILRDCVSEQFCAERHGHVMSAVESLTKVTKDLTASMADLKERMAADEVSE